MDVLQILFAATNQLLAQLIVVMPKLIISMIIWYLGRYLLSMASKLLKGLDIEDTHIDEKAIETLSVMINAVGSAVLVLIILDYLGIGTSVVSAIAQGVTFAIAIALGISFGKALEPQAKDVVDSVNKIFKTDIEITTKKSNSRFSDDKNDEDNIED